MDITPLVAQGSSIIQSYAEGGFRVSGQVYKGPVIVTVDHVVDWPVGDAANLSVADFATLEAMSDALDVVLLGCGAVPPGQLLGLRLDMKARGLNLELMDTGAACRTFNVLMTEGRRVAAALFPV